MGDVMNSKNQAGKTRAYEIEDRNTNATTDRGQVKQQKSRPPPGVRLCTSSNAADETVRSVQVCVSVVDVRTRKGDAFPGCVPNLVNRY
jgi:hypothetical protein